MYNSQVPSKRDLPSSQQLKRSTIFALCCATVLMVTVVLPAEYGRDPSGVGELLGLTEMGKIKQSLAQEAALQKLTKKDSGDAKQEAVTVAADAPTSPAAAQAKTSTVAPRPCPPRRKNMKCRLRLPQTKGRK